MPYQIGQLIIGKVIKVKPFAIFMSFEDGSEGLLHISEISDSYVRDIEKYGSKGDEIKVKVVSIDESNGYLRVSLKRVPPEEAYSTHSNNIRRVPECNEGDFNPLKERLDGWIKDMLVEAEKEGK